MELNRVWYSSSVWLILQGQDRSAVRHQVWWLLWNKLIIQFHKNLTWRGRPSLLLPPGTSRRKQRCTSFDSSKAPEPEPLRGKHTCDTTTTTTTTRRGCVRQPGTHPPRVCRSSWPRSEPGNTAEEEETTEPSWFCKQNKHQLVSPPPPWIRRFQHFRLASK